MISPRNNDSPDDDDNVVIESGLDGDISGAGVRSSIMSNGYAKPLDFSSAQQSPVTPNGKPPHYPIPRLSIPQATPRQISHDSQRADSPLGSETRLNTSRSTLSSSVRTPRHSPVKTPEKWQQELIYTGRPLFGLEKQAEKPGPGTYVYDSNKLHPRGPAYSMASRAPEPHTPRAPGPGAYDGSSTHRSIASNAARQMGTLSAGMAPGVTRTTMVRRTDAPAVGTYDQDARDLSKTRVKGGSVWSRDTSSRFSLSSAQRDKMRNPGPGQYDAADAWRKIHSSRAINLLLEPPTTPRQRRSVGRLSSERRGSVVLSEAPSELLEHQ